MPLIDALKAIAALLVLGPVLAWFPAAALGALVIFAAIRLIDVAELRRIARFRRSELLPRSMMPMTRSPSGPA